MTDHEHQWSSMPGGRMYVTTPAGEVDVANYPEGERLCRLCAESDGPSAGQLAVESGRRSFNPPLDGLREWMARR